MWSEFESEVVAGRYPLGRPVRSEGRYGWFETKYQDQPALISLIEALNDEDSLLSRLKAAAQVQHPNVNAILETGTATARDTPLVYAVMEFTEENLGDVLRVRALTEEETRQVAESLLDGLSAIHKNKLIVSDLEASSVLASGDTIKLRSDRLQSVASSTKFEQLAAKDLQDFANLLYRCLTQRSVNLDANDPSIQLLPRSIVPVVRKALGEQATAEDLIRILRPPVQATAPAPSAQPVPKKTLSLTEAPVAGAKALEAVSHSPRKIVPWIIAGAVVILVVIGFAVNSMMHPSSATDAKPEPVATASVPSVPAPSAPAVVATSPAAKPAVAPQSVDSKGSWRVVAYTYNQQDQAEHKAHMINERHPDLQADVFSPKGNGAPYLVTLGGPMERAAAFELRGKAIREGLPSDTYAQNYRH